MPPGISFRRASTARFSLARVTSRSAVEAAKAELQRLGPLESTREELLEGLRTGELNAVARLRLETLWYCAGSMWCGLKSRSGR